MTTQIVLADNSIVQVESEAVYRTFRFLEDTFNSSFGHRYQKVDFQIRLLSLLERIEQGKVVLV